MEDISIRIETSSPAEREVAVQELTGKYLSLIGRLFFDGQLVKRDMLHIKDSRYPPYDFIGDGYYEFVFPSIETRRRLATSARLDKANNPDFAIHSDVLERDYDHQLVSGHLAVEFSNYGSTPVLQVRDLMKRQDSELPAGVTEILNNAQNATQLGKK